MYVRHVSLALATLFLTTLSGCGDSRTDTSDSVVRSLSTHKLVGSFTNARGDGLSIQPDGVITQTQVFEGRVADGFYVCHRRIVGQIVDVSDHRDPSYPLARMKLAFRRTQPVEYTIRGTGPMPDHRSSAELQRFCFQTSLVERGVRRGIQTQTGGVQPLRALPSESVNGGQRPQGSMAGPPLPPPKSEADLEPAEFSLPLEKATSSGLYLAFASRSSDPLRLRDVYVRAGTSGENVNELAFAALGRRYHAVSDTTGRRESFQPLAGDFSFLLDINGPTLRFGSMGGSSSCVAALSARISSIHLVAPENGEGPAQFRFDLEAVQSQGTQQSGASWPCASLSQLLVSMQATRALRFSLAVRDILRFSLNSRDEILFRQ